MRPTTNRGFSYFSVLIILAILSGSLALVGEVWSSAAQREKELELLHVGQQYRKAIERYYLNGLRQYPRTLNDLLKDPRKPVTERYLRNLYADPMTGSNEWGIVKGPDGGIMGVHSLAEKEPIKRVGFKLRDAAFENTKTYIDWKFIYSPPAAATTAPGATPPTPGATPPQQAPARRNP